MKLVRIEWWDACHHAGWVSPDEADRAAREDSCLNVSVGYLILEVADRVALAQSYGIDADMVGDVLVIPTPCIVKTEVLSGD